MSPFLSFLCRVVAEQNWIFVSILVPISLTYDFYDYACKLVDRFHAYLTYVHHDERLRRVQRQLKEWRELPERKVMCTARPSWKSISFQPMAYKNKMHKINIDLPDILSIDKDKKTCSSRADGKHRRT